MKKKTSIILIIVLLIFSIFAFAYNQNKNFYHNHLYNLWGLEVKEDGLEIVYESERGFQNDGDRLIKINSKDFDYNVKCSECIKDIDLESDMELINEIIKESELDKSINSNDLEIIETIKINDFKYLIISYEQINQVYYLFERLI